MKEIPISLKTNNYINELKHRKRFIDLVHDGLGNICKMVYNPITKNYELEPIEDEYHKHHRPK